MKVIRDYKELEGKTIAFCHVASFAEQITIATTDNCIYMAGIDNDEDYDSPRIQTMFEGEIMTLLNNDKGEYLRNQLAKRGLFDLVAFKEMEKEKRRKEMEANKKKQEDRERAEYERLKLKFEGK